MFGILAASLMCLGLAVAYLPDQLLGDYNSDYEVEKRHPVKEVLTECLEMKSDAGIYQVQGTGDQNACGIFLVGEMETQVNVEFLDFDVDCQDGGVVSVLDGWEQNGSIFPPVEDLGKSGILHKSFCGPNRPKQEFRSSGNMVLIQYRIPVPGVGFLIRITFPTNPKPCNAVSFLPEGKFMLRNYGSNTNCSVMMMYPEKLTFTYINVGARDLKTTALSLARPNVSPNTKCTEKDKSDYVEVRGGGSFEMRSMTVFRELCGFHPLTRQSHSVFCGATMVRLVSSGQFDNTVVVENSLLESYEGLDDEANICSVEDLAA